MKKIISALVLLSLFNSAYALEEDFMLKYLDPNLKINPQKEILVEDELIKYLKPKAKEKKIYIETGEIRIKPLKIYSTKKDLKEGDYIDFLLLDDIKGYPNNSIIKGRVETISPNAKFGVPADIVIDNFMIDNKYIFGSIDKRGADRTLWVLPLRHLLNLTFGVGFILFTVKGGHAKLDSKEVYTIGD